LWRRDLPKCAVCEPCKVDADCAPGFCESGLCAATIEVVSAVYAANCGAPTQVPTIVAACDGQKTCNYVFNYTVDIGYDPAYGCYKDLKVDYQCSGGTTTKTYYRVVRPLRSAKHAHADPPSARVSVVPRRGEAAGVIRAAPTGPRNVP
jgi:hypothetical protein